MVERGSIAEQKKRERDARLAFLEKYELELFGGLAETFEHKSIRYGRFIEGKDEHWYFFDPGRVRSSPPVFDH